MGMRDFVKSISPSWAQSGAFERYLYTLGLAMDGVLDKATQAVNARMPGLADVSALPFIGADRLIPQGLTEAAVSYAARLTTAFDDWQKAGNAWAVLRQALGYVLSSQPAARTVSSRSTTLGVVETSLWNSYAASANTNAAPLFQLEANWDWDSTSRSPTETAFGWWRWWLILYSVAPNAWIGKAPKWGTGVKWGSGNAWGVDKPASVGRGLRSLVGLWGAEHAWCHEIIVSFDSTLFNPLLPSGGGINPDGKFGRWSKIVNGQYVPARFANARYGEGI